MNQDIIYLRKGMIDELNTVNEYTERMNACKDEHAKQVYESIIKEELVHVGEFMEAINRLCECQDKHIAEGRREADLMDKPLMEQEVEITPLLP